MQKVSLKHVEFAR